MDARKVRNFSPYPALLAIITVLTYRGLLSVNLTWLLAVPVLFFCYFVHRQWYLGGKRVPGLKQKAVLITGCDSGFGQHLALKLHSLGVRVYAGCLTEDGVQRLTPHPTMRPFIMDITKQSDIDNARNYILSDIPQGFQFWALVNNAAILGRNWFDICHVSDFQRVMSVNFYAQIAVTNTFLPLLRRSHGRVVTVGSVSGRTTPVTGPYTCSKHALNAYLDGLRRAMNRCGVKVATIEPGFVNGTGISDLKQSRAADKKVWDSLPEEVQQDIGQEFFDKYYDSEEKGASNLLVRLNKIDTVVNAMCHAVCATSPRYRYTLGWDSYLWNLPVQWLPDSVLDVLCHS